MNYTANLLPCPFCGSQPDFLMPTGKIYCFNQECPCGPEVHSPVIGPFKFDYDAAINAWNTRYQLTHQEKAAAAFVKEQEERLESDRCHAIRQAEEALARTPIGEAVRFENVQELPSRDGEA